MESANSERVKERLRRDYKEKDQEVKHSLRKDKSEWDNSIALEAEHAAKLGQMKGVHNATRKLCNEQPKKIDMVRSKTRQLLTKVKEVQQRWKEHFVEVLNRPDPDRMADLPNDIKVMEEMDAGPISKDKIRSVTIEMDMSKAPGEDSITEKLL